jgi:hypothetical protein
MGQVGRNAVSPGKTVRRFPGREGRPVDSQDEPVMAFADPPMNSLLLGIPVLVTTLTVQATATMIIVRFVSALVRRGLAGRHFLLDVAVMMVVLLVTLASILAQVAIWAAGLIACGEFGDFDTAFYHSAVNFSTLGYGDIVMSPTWRLLGPLEAINGILMCGITASALFTVANRLIRMRLRQGEQN